jgi:tryptophan synthase alpha chain
MNRINYLFKHKKKNILSLFITAGFPNLKDTKIIIETSENSGVDLIEIGIPFSDPLADGPVIQASSEKALKNGISLNLLFEQIKDIRETVKIPLIMMGYFNSILQFGVEKFCINAQNCGIDGVILPDLPIGEFLEKYENIFQKYGLKNIFLITPQTSEERIQFIDKHSDSFIYMVSSASTTGAVNQISEQQKLYFERIQKMNLKNPKLIGFGISDRKAFLDACRYAEGAIVGSAFIKMLSESVNLENDIDSFVKNIINQ